MQRELGAAGDEPGWLCCFSSDMFCCGGTLRMAKRLRKLSKLQKRDVYQAELERVLLLCSAHSPKIPFAAAMLNIMRNFAAKPLDEQHQIITSEPCPERTIWSPVDEEYHAIVFPSRDRSKILDAPIVRAAVPQDSDAGNQPAAPDRVLA